MQEIKVVILSKYKEVIFMARIDNVYHYYVTNYLTKTDKRSSRYDTHKQSDLQDVYQSIVNISKNSPLYKIHNTESTKKYAIDVKEHARQFQNTLSALFDETTSDSSADIGFQKKIASSSNEDYVTASYIGNTETSPSQEPLEIEVFQLATSQKNSGNALVASEHSFPPGDYSFDINIEKSTYEFQFSVTDSDRNVDIQRKLGRLINNSNIGIRASVEKSGDFSALNIESQNTGVVAGSDTIFSIAPSEASKNSPVDAAAILGLDHVTSYPQNAFFTLNQVERTALSNSFTVNRTFEINLKQLTDGEPVRVGFHADSEAIKKNINDLADGYNSMIQTAQDYKNTVSSNSRYNVSNKLLLEISHVGKQYRTQLSEIGLKVNHDGSITVDEDQLEVAASQDDNSSFEFLKSFGSDLEKKVSNAVINPMDYVNKLLVAYKNPGKNYVNPYVTSEYSGMLFNNYC